MNQLITKVLMRLGLVIIVVSLTGCDRLFPGTGNIVERVSDGDTLVLRGVDNQKFTVRFACVDAPEIPHTNKEKSSRLVRDKNQFGWGVKAQARLQELIKQGGDRVKLDIIESDRYGRKVAEVRLKDGTFIQQVLLQEGLAKVYRSYLSKCPSKDILQQTEAQAQQQKVGVWSDRKFVDPWEYRKLSKAN
jgi:endonuclease YncB( thermonuclease family)